MQERLEKDLADILSICQDYKRGYAKSEQALGLIQEIAANGLGMWACRFCLEVFSGKTAKGTDYFGYTCLPCATRASRVVL